ncbi:MAG: hypothetical protein M1833_000248 [Piccolia ochrophora]|nr:MAG: hypothetical protein M1833_000248 [Piccolia ochrophora]
MAMAVDNQQRHLGSLGFDNLHSYSSQPHFTNPWESTAAPNGQSHLFPSSLPPSNLGLDTMSRQSATRPTTMSMPYSTVAAPAPSLPAGSGLPLRFGQQDLHSLSQDMLNTHRIPNPASYGGEHNYATAPSPASVPYAPTSAPYDTVSYGQKTSPYMAQQQDHERRISQPPDNYVGSSMEAQRPRQDSLSDFGRGLAAQQSRENFGDAIDAGRAMAALSQDVTPRNIYPPRSARGSTDSYGFPSTHSSNSSVSSVQSYPSYYGSVESSSVTDYSSASESMDMPSRTLPRPQGLLAGSLPPAPQSMMGQFSSKVSSSTQKKHKCKVCDKRFTRPSSLQTHMYSHTGEKPFACDVDGCGRHFSVVSNLRRHRKVHKGERDISPDVD